MLVFEGMLGIFFGKKNQQTTSTPEKMVGN